MGIGMTWKLDKHSTIVNCLTHNFFNTSSRIFNKSYVISRQSLDYSNGALGSYLDLGLNLGHLHFVPTMGGARKHVWTDNSVNITIDHFIDDDDKNRRLNMTF